MRPRPVWHRLWPLRLGATYRWPVISIALANDSDSGLASALWTGDVGRAHALAERIQAGQMVINDYIPIGPEAPFGSCKKSGFGREKGLRTNSQAA